MTYEEYLKKHSLTQENSVATRRKQNTKKKLSKVSDLLGGNTTFAGKNLELGKTTVAPITNVAKADAGGLMKNSGKVAYRNDGGTRETRLAEANAKNAAAKKAADDAAKERDRYRRTFDINAARERVKALQEERKALQSQYAENARRGQSNAAAHTDALRKIDNKISSINADIYKAEKVAEADRYNALPGNADYNEKSGYTPSVVLGSGKEQSAVEKTAGRLWGYTDESRYRQGSRDIHAVSEALNTGSVEDKDAILHDYINGAQYAVEGVNHHDAQIAGHPDALNSAYRKYRMMTNDEVKRYNYIYNTEGAASAKEYLSAIEGTLNSRLGQTAAAGLNDAQKVALGLKAGVDSFNTGIKQMFTDEVKPTTATQYAGQTARENLGKGGQFAYDFAQLVGNMAPSIMLSTAMSAVGGAAGIGALASAAPVVGSASMGMSAYGNAYADMMQRTGNKEKSKAYAALVGASESTLSYLLSGISALGGKAVSASNLAKAIDSIGNIYVRTAANFAKAGISEGVEETLQEYLEPMFYSAVFGGDYEAPEFKDAARTFLLAALSGGMFEGGTIVSSAAAEVSEANDIYKGLFPDGKSLTPLIDSAIEMNDKKLTKMATDMRAKVEAGEDVSGAEIRKLSERGAKVINARGKAAIRSQTSADAATAIDYLVRKHEASKTKKTGLETAKQEMERKTEGVRRADAKRILENPTARDALKEYGYKVDAEDQVASVRGAIKAIAEAGIDGKTAVASVLKQDAKEARTDSAEAEGITPTATADTTAENIPAEGEFEGNTEVMENGEGDLHLRYGSERNDGADSSVPVRSMEESAGRDSGGKEVRSGPRDEEAASLTYSEEVESKDVIPGGLNNKIRVLKEGDTEYTRKAKEYAAERGLELVLFAGDNLHVDKDGREVSARGAIRDGKIYVRADHPEFTADQIVRHEIGHDMIRNGEVDPDSVRERLRDILTPEQEDILVGMYLEAYTETGKTADEVWEEIICDSLGDLNIFSGDILEQAAGILLENTRIATEENIEERRTRGPPVEVLQHMADVNLAYDAETDSVSMQFSEEKNWRTKFPKSLMLDLLSWVKYDIKYNSNNELTDTANFTFKYIREQPVFAIYSTEVYKDPTVLYASKGKRALFERDYLISLLEEVNREQHLERKSENIDTVLNRRWLHEDRSAGNNNGGIRTGSNNRNVGVLQQPSRRKPTDAFKIVVNNLLEAQETKLKENGTQFSEELTTAHTNKTKRSQETMKKLESLRTGALSIVEWYGDFGYDSAEEALFDITTNWDYFTKALTFDNENDKKVLADYVNAFRELNAQEAQRNDSSSKTEVTDSAIRTEAQKTESKERAKETDKNKKSESAASRKKADDLYRDLLVKLGASASDVSGASFADFIQRDANDESILPPIASLYTYADDVMHKRMDEYIAQGIDEDDAYDRADKETRQIYSQIAELGKIAKEEFGYADYSSPSENEDVRFSEELTTLSDLRKDNERLRKQLAHWRNEVKTTDKPTVRRDDVEKLSRRLVRDYHLTVSAEEVTNIIEPLANLLAKNEDVTWNQVRKIVEPAARQMVESAEVLNDDAWSEYKELHEFIKKQKIVLSPEEAAGIPDYADWRKQNGKIFGGIALGGSNVNGIYEELASNWNEFFDAKKETNAADRLLRIVEVMNRLTPIYENPYDFNISAATEYLADDIMDSMISTDIRRVKTYADRANEKLKAAKQKRIDDLRKKTQSANARALRDRIIRHSSKMYQDLGTIRKDRNIPEDLRAPVAAVLDAINFESKHTVVEDENGRRHVAPEGVVGDPTKRTTKFAALKAAYQKLAGSISIDPNIIGMGDQPGILDNVISMADVRIDDMNSRQLEDVWSVIRSMEQAITTWNKAFRAGKAETISEVADHIYAENAFKKSRDEFKHGGFHKLLEVDNLTPEAYFHRIGKVGDSLFRMLRNAQDEQIRILAETTEFAHKAIEESLGKDGVRKLDRSIVTVRLGNKDVKMTASQLMELYALTRRPHALMHILTGGIRLDSMDIGKNKLLGRSDVIRNITEDELNKAFGKLTEGQKKLADILQDYSSTKMSAYGNRASMEVYGVKKFTEEYYWPIRTHTNDTKRDQETAKVKASSMANKGFTNQVKPDAKTSLRIGSLFDTFANHSVEMSAYSAFLAPMEDLNRIRNYKFHGIEDVASVGDLLNLAVGRGNQGADYLATLMEDLSVGVAAKDTDINPMSQLIGNYKAASVGANVRVIMQQWTAGLRAFDMVDPKYFVSKSTPKKGWEKALKYAPIAQWKDWGYFDVHTGRQIKDVMFNSDSALDKAKQIGMAGAGWMDSMTWGVLWNACENEVADKHKDIKRGTDAFYKKVAERFNEVVDHTQVVDGILQRSQIMRAPGTHTKLATAFLAEPTKQINMAMSAVSDYRNARTKDKKAEAGKKLRRTALSLCVAGIVNGTLGTALIDGIRDDDDEKNYWEKILSAMTGLSGDEKTVGDYVKSLANGNVLEQFNPLGMIPYVKDVWSTIQGYTGKSLDDAALNDIVTAVNTLVGVLKGDGKKSAINASLDLSGAIATAFGIPIKNVKRDVLALTQTIINGTENSLVKYRYAKLMMNPSENKNTFLAMMYDAYKNDKDAYEIIRKDLLREGFAEEDLDGGIKSGIKTAFDLSGYVEDKAKANNYLYSELEKLGGGKASNVMPDDMSPVITYKDDKDKEVTVQLDEKEYAKFQKDVGDKAFEILKNTVGGAKWKSMTNDEKKSAISYAYQIARAYGKQNASGYEADDKWLVKALEKAEHADEIVTYKAMRMSYDKNKDGKLNATERNAAINAIAKTEEEKRLLRMLS